ncbi:putative capsular polysaccharide synthesis family protein [Pseudoalteromonas xiamenensis]|uniref:putative capsular polysaccharide synthesis family protein n=1 Tax=Pseudoalteromonas xiamenensis TaxID=882626 RepID=UPI0035E81200
MKRLNRLVALYRRVSHPDTIFIYQMGKVGSTSLEHSIPQAMHIHAFYSDNHTCPIRMQGLAGNGLRYFFKRAIQEIEYFVMRWAFRKRTKTKIITLVREPLKRNISMFFHDLDSYLFAYYTGFAQVNSAPKTTREQHVDVLKACFLETFPHTYPLHWFDNEFYCMTGIDIFAHPFDKQKGQGVVQSENYEVLVLNMNKLSENTELLSEFTGVNIDLCNSNVGDNKWYAELYSRFNADDPAFATLKQQFTDSKYFKHFY